jgi:iron uptake system EfeUOB component EfeO/EfeM
MRAVAAVLMLTGLMALGTVAPARASRRPCSSYPKPGSAAPAKTPLPAGIRHQYAILRRPQHGADKLTAQQLAGFLSASGIVRSEVRLLGRAAFGARVYLVPALHLLSFPIAPARCLPPQDRELERLLRPQLRREYAHAALCLVVVTTHGVMPSCAAASSHTEALQYTSGTPGFGLVPDGVRKVIVSYTTAPSRLRPVRENFFSVIAPAVPAQPCGLQWLDRGGTVLKNVSGCSFIALEAQPLAEYRQYVAGKLATVQSQVAALVSAIGSGDLAQARAAWLTAHLTWLQIGQDDGAYGCFGTLGGEIDGLAAGHALGTADPGFTGFHKVELDLWTSDSLTDAAVDAGKLQSLLDELVQIPLAGELPATTNGIANWLLRVHEILEDANRDTITANDDYGSHTDLASLTADISATGEMLNLLAPVIDPIAPHLVSRARRELSTLGAEILATGGSGGGMAMQSMPAGQRQQIDADTGAVLETLAPIPDLITSTGNKAPNT